MFTIIDLVNLLIIMMKKNPVTAVGIVQYEDYYKQGLLWQDCTAYDWLDFMVSHNNPDIITPTSAIANCQFCDKFLFT